MHQDLGADGERASPAVTYGLFRPGLVPLLFAIAALTLSACQQAATSTDLAIAPSAEMHTEAILAAVDRLNAELGELRYTVRASNTERMHDGLALVIAEACPDAKMLACTLRMPEGVLIRLPTHIVDPRVIAHEMGHSAGLDDVDQRDNLMFRTDAAGSWKLEAWQLEEISR
jgi:hypothetical protein